MPTICMGMGVPNWYLDAKSKTSHMKIRRHQLPLAPDFARTAYSMQGFTLHAGKVDLKFGERTDPVTGYVALSRFKAAHQVLILQPFDLAVFQQGVADQPALLLEHLRGNDISGGIRDLLRKREEDKLAKEEAARAARSESCKRRCSSENLDEGQKQKKARKVGDTQRYKSHMCTGPCGARKGRTEYSDWEWRHRNKRDVRCLQCQHWAA